MERSPGAILWVPVVSLPGALQRGLGVLPDRGDPALLIDDANDTEGGEVESGRGGGDRERRECLGVRVQILLETVDHLIGESRMLGLANVSIVCSNSLIL